MIPIRSRFRLSLISESLLVLKHAPGRRIIFFILFLLLLGGAIAGMDAGRDFRGGRIVGTLLYFGITISTLVISTWGKTVAFDRQNGKVVFTSALFLVSVSISSLSLEAVKGIVLESVSLMKSDSAPLGRRFSQFMENRSTIYRLYIETDEKRILLEDGTHFQEFEETARGIAGFLQVPLKTREL
jgi:hypothetical protein